MDITSEGLAIAVAPASEPQEDVRREERTELNSTSSNDDALSADDARYEAVRIAVAALSRDERPRAKDRALTNIRQATRNPAARSVGIALAQRVNWKAGEVLHSSKGTLAADTGYCQKQVGRGQRELRRQGVVLVRRVKSPKGDWDRNRYVFPAMAAGGRDIPVPTGRDADVGRGRDIPVPTGRDADVPLTLEKTTFERNPPPESPQRGRRAGDLSNKPAQQKVLTDLVGRRPDLAKVCERFLAPILAQRRLDAPDPAAVVEEVAEFADQFGEKILATALQAILVGRRANVAGGHFTEAIREAAQASGAPLPVRKVAPDGRMTITRAGDPEAFEAWLTHHRGKFERREENKFQQMTTLGFYLADSRLPPEGVR